MKKSILFIWLLWFFFSFSYGAVLSLSPSEWDIPENCIQSFMINLSLYDWEEAFATDLILDSNMEFVYFEKWDLFKYALPPKTWWNNTYLALLNSYDSPIYYGGIVWTVYYNTTNVEDPYINFVFDWEWETRDTNVSVEWRDILNGVRSGKYTISENMNCENIPAFSWEVHDIDDFIKDYESDHRSERFLFFLTRNRRYILWVAWLLIIILLLVSYKIQKKW